jgi:pyruvate-formate lyase-activating enzyme
MNREYTFRYGLNTQARREPIGSDALGELVRAQLGNVLDVAVPCRGGQEVKIDGFRLLGPDSEVRGLYGRERDPADQEIANAALYEPRIELVARQLQALLKVVELESGGQPVRIDGFRLKEAAHWTGPHVASPSDIFLHASSRCDLNCLFCYNRGATSALSWPERTPDEEWEELKARLEHYSPAAGRGLFPSYGSPRELLCHPHALHLLRELRRKTDAPLRFSTNGTRLTEEMAAALRDLRPLHLDVSLNSCRPARRAWLMGDPQPETAIDSLARLRDHTIPFYVSIVPWPYPSLEQALADLEETILFAAEHQAGLVQVNLPGYSRFSAPPEPFDTPLVWGEIVRRAHRLRMQSASPIVIRPALYEENLTRSRKNVAEVIGTVPNSPAAQAGLRQGDVIATVNGIPVRNRVQARDLLTILQQSGGEASITVVRQGRHLELQIRKGMSGHPFDPRTGTHLGAVFMGSGFRLAHLERLRDLVREREARDVLLLTSTLVKPTLEQVLRENPWCVPPGCRLRLGVPENRYFGGNIMLGDLLLVQDFINFLQDYLQMEESRPDLVVVPSSPFHLSGWKRDLTGRVYLDIEREVGVPVALLECDPMWD